MTSSPASSPLKRSPARRAWPGTAAGAIFVALVVLLAAGCAGTKGGAGFGSPEAADRTRAQRSIGAQRLQPSSIDLDLSPAATILSLWAEPGDSATARARGLEIATDLPYETTRYYFSTIMSCIPSDAEVARAIAVPDSGVCGFGLGWTRDKRAEVDSLVRALVLRHDRLRETVARDAGAYLPRREWKPIRAYFVLASRDLFDAATLDHSLDRGGPVIVFNLTEALLYGGSTEERAAIVERVLAHECFHAGFRQNEFDWPGWATYHDPRNAFDFIARAIVDEGVAHYVDWKARAGADTLFTNGVGPREKKAFDQLALACRRIRDPYTDPEMRAEILGMAATGPLWSKYAAISGMFAASRIERRWGADSLRAAIAAGPREFRRMYAAIAARDTTLKRWPKELD